MNEGYSSKRLEVRRPPIFVTLAQIVAGGLTILFCVMAVFSILNQFRRLLRFSGDYELTYTTLIALVAMGVILIYGIQGLKFVISGISEWISPLRPAKVPEDYRDYYEVAHGFRQRTLNIYGDDETLKKFRWIFGYNTRFISPARKAIFNDLGKSLGGRISGIILLVIIVVVFFFMRDQLGISGSSSSRWLMPILLMVAVQLAAGAVELVVGFMMVPRGQPSTTAQESTEHYRGFGHPSQIFARLPDLAIPLRWEGFLNRVYKGADQISSPVVGDVGNFSGFLIIERQPKAEEQAGPLSGYILLAVGWAFYTIGAAIQLFAVIPGAMDGMVTIPLAGLFFLGLMISSNGSRFVRRTRSLFEIVRFRSQAILIELEGNLFRSDIRVGKSMVDSIETSNVAVRSDFTARFWTAELVSEAGRLDLPRELLALEPTGDSQQWMQFFRTEINKLREEGVKPLGVDLGSAEVQQVVQANVGVSAMRAGAIETAELHGAPRVEELGAGTQPTPAVNNDPFGGMTGPTQPYNPADYKECPRCAEMVRVRAKVCRFCGHEF